MNPIYFAIPPALTYLYVAVRYALHVCRIDDEGPFAFLIVICLFPLVYLVTHNDSEGRYSDFRLFPKKPQPPTPWELEQKRMYEEARAAALQIEQLKARNQHRAAMDAHARELQRVMDEEDRRLEEPLP